MSEIGNRESKLFYLSCFVSVLNAKKTGFKGGGGGGQRERERKREREREREAGGGERERERTREILQKTLG